MAKKSRIDKNSNAKPEVQGHQGYAAAAAPVAPVPSYRQFGLCRIYLREMAHAGEIPGLTKASW